MKTVKQINLWQIKEKRYDEIPLGVDENRKYAIFTPTGNFQEDNLTWEEAVEFCQTNLDFISKK